MTEGGKGHAPVLCEEVMEAFAERSPGRFLDATFGGGGHSRALLEGDPDNHVVALDRDPAASTRAEALQAAFPERFRFHDMNFAELDQLEEADFSGILFDFGVSSFHFDEAGRGFSFREDASLDMRMDPREGRPAWHFLESADHRELVRAVREYGEEPRWRKIVSAIEAARGGTQLRRTRSFAELVETAVGGRRPQERIHPATRTFQGVRIAVNAELEAIETALPAAFAKLAGGGRLAAISFHSLEDRIVKRFFRRMAGKAEHAGDHRPEQLRTRRAHLLTRRPIEADEAERRRNPRSRSAKLRILEKEAA